MSDSKTALAPLRGWFSNNAVLLGEIVLKRAEAALEPLGLTPMGYAAMLGIMEADGPSQQELSRHLNMYAQKMVGVIDALEKQGLVERQVSPVDRRRHMLRATPAGLALMERAIAVAEAVETELFGEVPEADKARFNALVSRLKGADCD